MKNIFYNSAIARVVLCLSKCDTIMLFGLVFSKLGKDEMTQSTRNHESIHIRQWNEVSIVSGMLILALVFAFGISGWWMLLSVLPYYVWYVIEWMCRSLWYSIMIDEWTCDMETPYRSISFEKEAYENDENLDYLETRSAFAWWNYL